MNDNLKGNRNLIRDVIHAVCYLVIVALLVGFEPKFAVPTMIISAALYGGQGVRDFLGKLVAGRQDIARIIARNGGG